MVVVIAVHINIQTLVVQKVLSWPTLLGNTVSSVIEDIVDDAFRAVIEHIRGITIIGIRYASIVQVSEEGKTGDTGRDAA